jgi:S1-C subfamily serine protease
MRFALVLCLTVTVASPFQSAGAESANETGAWLATARIIRNGEHTTGSGVYLESGLIITAAHVVDPNSDISVNVAGRTLPAKVQKQGSLEGVDLSLLSVDPEKLPAALPPVPVCQHPPWPGDPVIVADATTASRSHVASPSILDMFSRHKFDSLISDVASTGNSGSGVFDPQRKCLLGIISRKFSTDSLQGLKDIAKYFVPANEIRDFLTAALKDAK